MRIEAVQARSGRYTTIARASSVPTSRGEGEGGRSQEGEKGFRLREIVREGTRTTDLTGGARRSAARFGQHSFKKEGGGPSLYVLRKGALGDAAERLRSRLDVSVEKARSGRRENNAPVSNGTHARRYADTESDRRRDYREGILPGAEVACSEAGDERGRRGHRGHKRLNRREGSQCFVE